VSEPPRTVEALLAAHSRIALDSNVLIYLMEETPGRADVAAALVDAVSESRVHGVLASVGLAEALVGPARADDGVGFEQAAALIRGIGFTIMPLDAAGAEDAAWIRGRTGCSLPDAVHLASARAAGATAMVTNDRRMRSVTGLEVLYFDDLIPEGNPT
jgi:predicted nucleic acid-binding protein